MNRTTLKFVRSDKKELSINGLLWDITALKGFDEPNITLYTQTRAIGDGDMVTAKRVGARYLDITLKTRKPSLNSVLTRQATSFFVKGYTYDLYVYRYGENRFAKGCHVDSVCVPTENMYIPITLEISLLSPEGYFLSVDSFGKNIAGIEGRCGYPYIANKNYGRIYGVYSFAQTVYLDNDGDANSYLTALFVAKGDVTNPKLVCENGFVQVLTTLSAGDTMQIDGIGKTVTINGVNAITALDKQSNFDSISLSVGTNPISFTADIGSNVLDVYVYYNKRYFGC